MFIRINKYFFVCFLLAMIPLSVAAQTRQVYVDSHGQRLLSAPHGGALATLSQNSPVKVLEDKDDWVKISVEGWVRRGALTSKKRTAKKKTKSLQLSKFEITKEPAADGSMQAWLKLTVKNNTEKKVHSWNSILIVRRPGGEVLFTTRVSHDDANIAPGEEGSVRYYWDAHEKQYSILLNTPKDSLQLMLHKLQVN